MAVKIYWDDPEKKVLHYFLSADSTWEEFLEAIEQAHRLIDDVSWHIGVLIHGERRRKYPMNMMSNIRQALRLKHPHTQIVVMVIHDSMLRGFIKHALKYAGGIGEFLYISSSEQHARDLIHTHLAALSTQS